MRAAVNRLFGALALLLPVAAFGSGDPAPITSIAQVRNLSPEVADQGLPVQIRGTITRNSPWEAFVQNGRDAIFVGPAANRQPYQPGDYVEFTGKTAAGHFLPIIMEETSRLLGHGPLPDPAPATYEDLASGSMDCRYVEVTGVVHVAEINTVGEVKCRLATNGAQLLVQIAASVQPPARLLGALVRMRGVAGGIKNRNRQIVQPLVWVQPTPETLQILSSPPADIFSLETVPIAKLMSASATADQASLVKIAGQVTWAESGTHIYVRDATDTIDVSLQAPASVQTGDHVELAGFPENGLIKPRLADAIARVIGHGGPPTPRKTTATALLSRDSEASLVTLEAMVEKTAQTADQIVLTLTDTGVTFHAVYAPGKDRAIPVLKIGSRVAIAGICQVEEAKTSDSLLLSATSFQLKVRSPDDVRVLWAPPFDPGRTLLIAVGALSAALCLAAIWIWSLHQTVARQTRVIVSQTRTEATMEERDRIAREFHDSLEQRLAGATILLDATACAWDQHQENARSHLNAARAMLRHSLNEAQRAVLDLRSRELEHHDLGVALEHSLRPIIASEASKCHLEVNGKRIKLDAICEDHVLRVAQEAVANALKHAGATQIRVGLTYDSHHLALRVEDNGQGFVAEPSQKLGMVGKFGLIGMRERAEKLHGEIGIRSAPGQGTTIDLLIPIDRNLARAKG